MPAGPVGAVSAAPAVPAGPAKQPAGLQIPTIDGRGFLARERRGTPPPPDVAAAISEAGRTLGSFQLVNHGVDKALIERMQAGVGWHRHVGRGRAWACGGRAAGICAAPAVLLARDVVQMMHASRQRMPLMLIPL